MYEYEYECMRVYWLIVFLCHTNIQFTDCLTWGEFNSIYQLYVSVVLFSARLIGQMKSTCEIFLCANNMIRYV